MKIVRKLFRRNPKKVSENKSAEVYPLKFYPPHFLGVNVGQNLPSPSLSPRDFSFRNAVHRKHEMSMSNNIREIFTVEDAARLDYIKGKVAKRTEEIIFHAECEKSVQIA